MSLFSGFDKNVLELHFRDKITPYEHVIYLYCCVLQVSCGGCHTIALAHQKDNTDDDEEILDPLNSTFANSLRLSADGDLNASISARDRRRAKEVSVYVYG